MPDTWDPDHPKLAEKARRLEQDIATAEADVKRRQERIKRMRAELADALFWQYIADHGVNTAVKLPVGNGEWRPTPRGIMGDALLELPGYRAYAWFGGYWELRDEGGTESYGSRTGLSLGCHNLKAAMAAAENAIREHAGRTHDE